MLEPQLSSWRIKFPALHAHFHQESNPDFHQGHAKTISSSLQGSFRSGFLLDKRAVVYRSKNHVAARLLSPQAKTRTVHFSVTTCEIQSLKTLLKQRLLTKA